MGNLNTRLSKLEQQRPATARPWLVLAEDYDNPNIFTDQAGRQHNRAELHQLEQEYQLILVTYATIGDMALWDEL